MIVKLKFFRLTCLKISTFETKLHGTRRKTAKKIRRKSGRSVTQKERQESFKFHQNIRLVMSACEMTDCHERVESQGCDNSHISKNVPTSID